MRPWIKASSPAHPTKPFMFPNRSLSEAPWFQQQQTSICLPNSWDMMTVVSQPRKDSFRFFFLSAPFCTLIIIFCCWWLPIVTHHMFSHYTCFILSFFITYTPKLFPSTTVAPLFPQCFAIKTLGEKKWVRFFFHTPSSRWNYSWLLPTTVGC